MTRKFTIQPAGVGDIPALSALLNLLFSIEQDFQPDPDKQRRGLAGLLADPARACILVARDGEGNAIGMASGQLVISTAEGAPSLWVEDVVIEPAWRGGKLGRALLDALLAWSRDKGATRAQLLADRDNGPALGFYQHLGWTRTALEAWRYRG